MRFLLAMFAALGLATAVGAGEPAGRVILTVAGDLPATNAPAAHADDLSVNGALGVEYEKAMAFDDLMLGELGRHDIDANLHKTNKVVTYSGPRLSDVLRAAGAEGKLAMPMALDGYQVQIAWDMIDKYQPILATHADGHPLSIGGFGPTMIVFPIVADRELYASFDSMQVFATHLIEVQ
jgi:hypothetical protein